MTPNAERRIAALNASAKARSQAKTTAAEQAIGTLVKRGEAITFQAAGREAGVSHAFLDNHPEMRARIEHLRAQTRPIPASVTPPNAESTLVLALTRQIAGPKKQHQVETQALRKALERAHGENLDLRRELDRRGWSEQIQARRLAGQAPTNPFAARERCVAPAQLGRQRSLTFGEPTPPNFHGVLAQVLPERSR